MAVAMPRAYEGYRPCKIGIYAYAADAAIFAIHTRANEGYRVWYGVCIQMRFLARFPSCLLLATHHVKDVYNAEKAKLLLASGRSKRLRGQVLDRISSDAGNSKNCLDIMPFAQPLFPAHCIICLMKSFGAVGDYCIM